MLPAVVATVLLRAAVRSFVRQTQPRTTRSRLRRPGRSRHSGLLSYRGGHGRCPGRLIRADAILPLGLVVVQMLIIGVGGALSDSDAGGPPTPAALADLHMMGAENSHHGRVSGGVRPGDSAKAAGPAVRRRARQLSGATPVDKPGGVAARRRGLRSTGGLICVADSSCRWWPAVVENSPPAQRLPKSIALWRWQPRWSLPAWPDLDSLLTSQAGARCVRHGLTSVSLLRSGRGVRWPSRLHRTSIASARRASDAPGNRKATQYAMTAGYAAAGVKYPAGWDIAAATGRGH